MEAQWAEEHRTGVWGAVVMEGSLDEVTTE